jgi:hypothetical protein
VRFPFFPFLPPELIVSSFSADSKSKSPKPRRSSPPTGRGSTRRSRFTATERRPCRTSCCRNLSRRRRRSLLLPTPPSSPSYSTPFSLFRLLLFPSLSSANRFSPLPLSPVQRSLLPLRPLPHHNHLPLHRRLSLLPFPRRSLLELGSPNDG